MERRDFLKTTLLTGAGVGFGFGLGRIRPARETHMVSSGGRMKLSFRPYELQLAHTFTVSSYSRTTTPDVQVEIEYEDFVGHGEASMPQYLGHTVDSVCSFLSKVDLSPFSDPLQLEEIMAYVNSLSDGDSPAKAAIDIALHDLWGQIVGQPLYRLWGYNPANAGDTTFTIGIDTPDVVREKTLECAGRFNILKVKVGLDSDKEMIETIRSVCDLPLAVDANQGWKDRSQALDMILWLKDKGVVMVEQPMPKEMIDDIAWITENSPIPIFGDESVQGPADIPAMKGVYSGINIKLMKCGGLLEARKMIAMAQTFGMRVMVGCMTETSCAVTAASHLSPAADFSDLDGNLLITNDLFEGMVVRDGHMVLPDRPGLGLKEPIKSVAL